VNKLLLVLLIMIGATMAHGQKVEVGFDRSVDLTKYKTYGWDKATSLQNPIIKQMIVEAVDRSMALKGFTKVESSPDINVAIWAATESDLQISYPSWSPALNSIQTGIVVGSQTFPVTRGTLVVDLLDAQTKNSVWRGQATDTLKHGPTGNPAKDAKSVEKPIRKAVEKMFKKFPSQVGR
jgi:Domain of unknown function (DUF4136)